MKEIKLENGWFVTQDVHDAGERLGVFNPGFNACDVSHAFSEWQPIDRLGHLQTILADNPYYGRQLRYFNEHPWWYRIEFEAPKAGGDYAALRFCGVDYFCTVWLNGNLLGGHEGYSAPFTFDVTDTIKRSGPNVLVVKVWSPWDTEIIPGFDLFRTYAVVRDMVKGTYEHADTFIQRDVNPVGIWGDVTLLLDRGVRLAERPRIRTKLSGDRRTADVSVTCRIADLRPTGENMSVECRILDEETGVVVGRAQLDRTLDSGESEITLNVPIAEPRLWWTWDRGEAALYAAVIEVRSGGEVVAGTTETFGIRDVELIRTEDRTTFMLNGEKLYIRGTTYFPEVYVSNMYRRRYYGDLLALRRAGCNAVRIHVHTEKEDLYDLCDRLGIAVVQDSDLSWLHPQDEAWKDRAVAVFGYMVRELRNHPSILAWVCFNEPLNLDGDPLHFSESSSYRTCPAPQVLAEAERLDPDRPAIKGSGAWDDLESGDSHNWTGSINGQDTHYTDIFGNPEKLNSEFGFDAPPDPGILREFPEVYERLRPSPADVERLQHYQYRLIKYFIERYRITKHNPCSGYFQFMFRDLCPQSFYGVYDWWGVPKEGLRALEESNQPLGVFLDYRDRPLAVWAVNDLTRDFGVCRVQWTASIIGEEVLSSGECEIHLSADCAVKAADLDFPVDEQQEMAVVLTVRDAAGTLLTKNRYLNPFRHPAHPAGHHVRVSHETGMRVYDLGDKP